MPSLRVVQEVGTDGARQFGAARLISRPHSVGCSFLSNDQPNYGLEREHQWLASDQYDFGGRVVGPCATCDYSRADLVAACQRKIADNRSSRAREDLLTRVASGLSTAAEWRSSPCETFSCRSISTRLDSAGRWAVRRFGVADTGQLIAYSASMRVRLE